LFAAEGIGAVAPTKATCPDRSSNRLALEDRAVHDWYRFVLAFPPHLVRAYFDEFGMSSGHTLLDPFCGTGTTLVEGKKLGCNVLGFEANPMAHLAANVKTRWDIDGETLLDAAQACAQRASRSIASTCKMRTLPAEAEKLLLKNSICPKPLHKALILAEIIDHDLQGFLKEAAQVALASALVQSASNLHFGPEVGVRGRKLDADVVGAWLKRIHTMVGDLSAIGKNRGAHGTATIFRHDARQIQSELAPQSVHAVFTSPPYPNEKDYTRTTRLESVVLGFFANKAELRTLKKQLVRSNTRGVYREDTDEQWVAGNGRIEAICEEIEARRVRMGKTSGFERMYHRVTRLYFGGMVRQLASLRTILKPGAMLGYVVGDQASYLQVMIHTGEILGELAQELGYEVCRLDLFRERFATATRMQIREEVLVLRWPGGD
jgi:DNA modification methylase